MYTSKLSAGTGQRIAVLVVGESTKWPASFVTGSPSRLRLSSDASSRVPPKAPDNTQVMSWKALAFKATRFCKPSSDLGVDCGASWVPSCLSHLRWSRSPLRQSVYVPQVDAKEDLWACQKQQSRETASLSTVYISAWVHALESKTSNHPFQGSIITC